MSFYAKDAKFAALRTINDRKVKRLAELESTYTLHVALLKETAERGEWGIFYTVPNETIRDFTWYFENTGYRVLVAPQIKQDSANHTTYHVTWT